ncbi:MAG: hypothetical protein ACYCPS_01745 [Candidatus Saccharimonadales bacterium]
MKRIIISVIILISGMLIFSPTVSAVNIFSQTCGQGTSSVGSSDVCHAVKSQAQSTQNPVIKTMSTAIKLISYIIGIAAIIIIIVGAIQMIVSGGGDSQAVKTGRSMIIYAAVGIAVAVLAQLIVVFVLDNIK